MAVVPLTASQLENMKKSLEREQDRQKAKSVVNVVHPVKNEVPTQEVAATEEKTTVEAVEAVEAVQQDVATQDDAPKAFKRKRY
jgi:hypothetical protein